MWIFFCCVLAASGLLSVSTGFALGKINWDFTAMNMQFTKGSSEVNLFGIHDGQNHAQNFSTVLTYGSQLEELLHSFTSLFLEPSGLLLPAICATVLLWPREQILSWYSHIDIPMPKKRTLKISVGICWQKGLIALVHHHSLIRYYWSKN